MTSCMSGAPSALAARSAPPSLFRRPIKTALHQAVLDGRLHQVRLLVDKHGGDVDSKDVHGRTPLMLACLLPQEVHGYKMARIFMKAGADTSAKDDAHRSALHYACLRGREGLVRMLLNEDGAEISAQDADGNSPLMLAALSAQPTIVRLLVSLYSKFGLSPDDRNGLGYTALLLACRNGHLVSAHVLLTIGKAQPALRDSEFHMNAREWAIKSSSTVHQAASTSVVFINRQRPVIEAPHFARERTVYGTGTLSPTECRHSGPLHHQAQQSLDLAALRLPAIFAMTSSAEKLQERYLGGENALQVVLRIIDEMGSGHRRPEEQVVQVQQVRVKPSTAKLLQQIGMSTRKGQRMSSVPSIAAIFRMYAEQRGSRLRDPSNARHLLRFGVDIVPQLACSAHGSTTALPLTSSANQQEQTADASS